MLRRIFTCYNQVRHVRTVSKKRIVSQNTPSPNPGIENRMKILEMESPYAEDMEEVDMDIDDLESDFMSAGKMHREFEREKIRASTSLSHAITKDKYFKSPTMPNLLTWSEKEQIRHLNQLDPKEWDAESLSKCFPSTLHVIKKIIKSKWKPKDKNALERHDRAVERNWILLKEGKFDLEDELRCHFLKFSSRKAFIPSAESHDTKRVVIHDQQQKCSEFSDLLSKNFKGLQEDDESASKKRDSVEVDIPEYTSRRINPKMSDQKSDSYLIPGETTKNRELMSFKEFKETLTESVAEDAEKNILSKRFHDYLNEESNEVIKGPTSLQESLPKIKEMKDINKLVKYKKENIEVNLTPKQLDVFVKAESYKHRIKIPKEKKDPSAVYQVNDCFYDSDGSFLYRVPGIK